MDVACLHVAARSIADHAPLPVAEATQQVLRAAIRRRGQQEPAADRSMRAHSADEVLHGRQHRLAVGEEVGVIHLHVGHDGPSGVVVQEVVAELISLHEERCPVAGADGGSPLTDEGADLHGRIHAGADQQVPEQGGGGRLAVRAGHGQSDPPLGRHQLAKHCLPGDDRQSALMRRDQLGKVRDRPQCGRDRHPVHAIQVGRVVSGEDADAGGLERRRVRRRRVGVATVDPEAGVVHQQRNPGCAGAGDADDVDALAGPHHGRRRLNR